MTLAKFVHWPKISQKCDQGKSFYRYPFLQYVSETFQKCLKIILKTCYQEQFNLMIRFENVLKRSLKDVLKMSWRCIENALKMSWRRFCKTSWRRLEDVLKTSWKRHGDVLKMFWRRFCKTFWRRLEDVWPRRLYCSWSRHLENVLKTSSEDAWVRRRYSSWSRRLEDLLKTSSEDEDERRLQDVF